MNKIIQSELTRSQSLIIGDVKYLRGLINKLHPEDISTADYADEVTGEVYLEKGHAAMTSELHFQYMNSLSKRFQHKKL